MSKNIIQFDRSFAFYDCLREQEPGSICFLLSLRIWKQFYVRDWTFRVEAGTRLDRILESATANGFMNKSELNVEHKCDVWTPDRYYFGYIVDENNEVNLNVFEVKRRLFEINVLTKDGFVRKAYIEEGNEQFPTLLSALTE